MTAVVAISPGGTLVATCFTPSSSLEEEDGMVGITIQAVAVVVSSSTTLPPPPPSTLQPQTIRVPSISSYLMASSSSSSSTTTTTAAAAAKYSVRRRQLMWLSGGATTATSSTTTATSTITAAETPYIGLITTLQTAAAAAGDHHHHSSSTTTTFLTVVDRTRGIPIYTLQLCQDPHPPHDDHHDTTAPRMIHDATGNTPTTTQQNRRRSHHRLDRTSSPLSSPLSVSNSRTVCCGIFPPPPPPHVTATTSKLPHYCYIAMATTTTRPTNATTDNSNNNNNNNTTSILLYECHVPDGTMVRKIKLGRTNATATNATATTTLTTKENDDDSWDIHQPWLSQWWSSDTTNNNNNNRTAMVTYGLPHSQPNNDMHNDHDNHDNHLRRSTGSRNTGRMIMMLRGMNLMDGSKLYKNKVTMTPRWGTTVVIQSATTLVSHTKSSESSASLSISVALDSDGLLQVYESRTGHMIGSPHHTSSPVTNHNDDDYGRVVRLQVQLTRVPPENAVTTNTIATATTKSKNTKPKSPKKSLPPQYCLWILINEQTLWPIVLQPRTVNSDSIGPTTTTTATNTTVSDLMSTVQPCYRIVASSLSSSSTTTATPTKTTTDDHPMRCSLIHPNDSAVPQLLVFQPIPSSSLSNPTIPGQVIPLVSPTLLRADDRVIRVMWSTDGTPAERHHPSNNDDDDNNNNNNMEEEEEDPMAVEVPANVSPRKPSQVVLGPGQSGGEARRVIETPLLDHTARQKRMKLSSDTEDNDDDTHEPTIAERLRLLQQALDAEDDDDEEDDNDDDPMDDRSEDDDDDHLDDSTKHPTDGKFVVKYATTESLTQLLIQALQSSDGTMLEQAFQVRDKYILRTTCQALSSDQVLVLLDALIQRLASKPSRAEQLVAWVSAILQSNQITNIQHLQPLQNLLAERLEVFPLLLQLEGRLENMIGM